ncbi:FABP family protein [Cryobacterium sp. Y11]|jgi:hypothetical protein|uniref:FABP family protein n=1 Tax=Cryobacterium sp. Y11 TaxID=2045016 RepID=UPI000CE50053|nr:FABP family protein [Cryobacterium sp. Y11]
MIDLPVDLPSELVPLSWLIGVWEGSGVLEYKIGEESISRTFGHRISFSHDGLPHLTYSSYTWLEPVEADAPAPDSAIAGSATGRSGAGFDAAGASRAGVAGVGGAASALDAAESASTDVPSTLPAALRSDEKTPLVTETGYWRLSRYQGDGDPGPGMLPGTGERPFTSAAAVETLRNRDGGFDIEVTLVHPGGVAELYLGQVKGPRIDLATDAVLRTMGAKPYAAATRLYGLVDNHLLWAWDIAALGQDLRTHASGRLARVE